MIEFIRDDTDEVGRASPRGSELFAVALGLPLALVPFAAYGGGAVVSTFDATFDETFTGAATPSGIFDDSFDSTFE